MIHPRSFIDALAGRSFRDFTGVPCSFFQAAINAVIDRPELRYTIVPNEGAALALAAGTYLAGKNTVLFIQNSGFGNLINPLTSLNMIYRLPVLIFMSGRAYGVADEPQHEVIGKKMTGILESLGVPFEDMPAESVPYENALSRAVEMMEKERVPFFFLVRKGTLEDYSAFKKNKAAYPLKRIDAIRIISESLSGDEAVVVTTGKPSRELFSVYDRPGNFYMQGSMGHAASIGFGVALAQPRKKVIVLDGDGALLMHLGALSSIGHTKPANLYHVVLDNESYESTGDQDTTSSTTDFAAVALACGYRVATEVSDGDSLKSGLKHLLSLPGPVLLRVKINRLPTEGIARISTQYDSPAIAASFRSGLGL